MKLEQTEKPQPVAPNPSTLEEVLDTRSADEIEKELVLKAENAALEAAEKMPPEDRAAIFFQSLYPNFEASLHGLPRKELVKLCAALVHYPLEELMPKTAKGAQTLMLGLQLTDAKLVMRETIAIEERLKMQQKTKEEAQALANSATTTFEMGDSVNEQGEVSNG